MNIITKPIISKELAYLLGVFIGDGSINYRQDKNEYSLKCVGNPLNEKEFYDITINNYFTKVFSIKPKIGFYDSKTTYGLRVYSKSLFEYLTSIGLPYGKKYNYLKIPLIVKTKNLIKYFIRGLVDTDGCISFKKKYKINPYYPVINISSKSASFIKEISDELKKLNFKIVEIYDRKVIDERLINGYNLISSIELNGFNNLKKWLSLIGFSNPKHLKKIMKYLKK